MIVDGGCSLSAKPRADRAQAEGAPRIAKRGPAQTGPLFVILNGVVPKFFSHVSVIFSFGGQRRSLADFALRGFFVPKTVVPKVRVELTQGRPYRFLSLVRDILVSRLIVLTNVWVRRFCHQVPSGQYLISINETALHDSKEFELASSRVFARRAKASERSRSA